MERIQTALDKAREHRIKSLDGSQIPHKKRHSSENLAKDITYTETKILKVSTEMLNKNRVILASEGESVSNTFKIFRTKVLHRMQALGTNTIAISSPTPGCGKSLTAINLAVNIASDVNYSVLLVDLDLKRPSLHRYFGYDSEPGIAEYLVDGVPLSELLINPGIDRLVVLTAGNKHFLQSSELLSTPRMVALFSEMKKRYAKRIIIFDLPPLLVTDDALVCLPHADVGLLVIEDGRTTPDEVVRSMELMEQTEFLGTVLNKSSDRQMLHYY